MVSIEYKYWFMEEFKLLDVDGIDPAGYESNPLAMEALKQYVVKLYGETPKMVELEEGLFTVLLNDKLLPVKLRLTEQELQPKVQ